MQITYNISGKDDHVAGLTIEDLSLQIDSKISNILVS